MLSVRDTTDSNCDKIFFRLRAIPHNYNLDNGYLSGYTSMIEASTILVKRNEKNNTHWMYEDCEKAFINGVAYAINNYAKTDIINNEERHYYSSYKSKQHFQERQKAILLFMIY